MERNDSSRELQDNIKYQKKKKKKENNQIE